MSGPLSSNEIEDVVSSVRRLVSVDARPRPVTRDPGPDRLVLTPALRVVPDQPIAPLILAHPTVDPLPAAAKLPTSEAPVSHPAAAEAMAADASADIVVEADWEDQIWLEPDPPLAELALGVEEAEVIGPGEDLSDADEAPWAQVEADWPDEEALAAVIPLGRAARAAPTDPAPPSQPAPAVAEAASARPITARPRKARRAAKDPVGDPPDPSADPAPAPDVTEADDLLDVPEVIPTLFDMDGNPLTVLDEDALHDIVRQLIREELQGALGERITRNVRKLVRAEINRALTARDLD